MPQSTYLTASAMLSLPHTFSLSSERIDNSPPVKDFVRQTGQVSSTQSSSALNRLLVAAVINQKFCHMLLTNPRAALAIGYRGETFALSSEERALVLQIRVTTLQEFAQQLTAATIGSVQK